MSSASDFVDRIVPTSRPAGRPAGYQTWSNLLFLHWEVSAYEIESMIPEPLAVDTFDGKAWIGLVLFGMSGVRPWWFPAVPGISSFLETNVRTYVHQDGHDPGVWFFSLDAASSLAVSLGKGRWNLPYHFSAMKLRRTGNHIEYSARRPAPGADGPGYSVEAEIGDELCQLHKDIPDGQAVPGSLEHFLTERYLMYINDPRSGLYRGRVHHKPYPLCEAQLLNIQESLLKSNELFSEGDVRQTVYSEGVDVEVFPLEKIE